MPAMPAARPLRPWLVLALLAAAAACLAIVLTVLTRPKPARLPNLGTLAPFELTQASGDRFTGRDLAGRPHLIQFVFSRCPGPCLGLSQQFREFQDRTAGKTDIGLVSVTVDPEHDTPAVLREHAARLGADPRRWTFVTGPKDKLYELIRSGFKVSAMENDDPNAPLAEQFIHTTKVVLLDRHGTVRGYYDGLDPAAYDQILEDLQRL